MGKWREVRELLGKAKWAARSTSILARAYHVFILRFCMKFHVEGKDRLLSWQCFQTTSQGMHYKSDSLVERSQLQERNKSPQKHLLNAPATTWILGKESPLQNHPSHVAITGSNTCVGRCCGTLVVFNLSQDLGACDDHFLTSFSKSHFLLVSPRVSNFVCAMVHFAVWWSLWITSWNHSFQYVKYEIRLQKS